MTYSYFQIQIDLKTGSSDRYEFTNFNDGKYIRKPCNLLVEDVYIYSLNTLHDWRRVPSNGTPCVANGYPNIKFNEKIKGCPMYTLMQFHKKFWPTCCLNWMRFEKLLRRLTFTCDCMHISMLPFKSIFLSSCFTSQYTISMKFHDLWIVSYSRAQ